KREPEEDDGDSEEGFSVGQKVFNSDLMGRKLHWVGSSESINRILLYQNGLPFRPIHELQDLWNLPIRTWLKKLIANGSDPLPRGRCFTRTPPHYTNPFPTNSSLWTRPNDANILWNHYKCEDYSCLVFVSKETTDKRGFFKCADCYKLSKRGWDIPMNESLSAKFTIDEVLSLKRGEIRIGLDFSPTTGTFAALMKEHNVVIASATLNLGAPFNEVIALRELLPLYVSVVQYCLSLTTPLTRFIQLCSWTVG
ncbi:LOW QUALITY PROTEIN: hypothetical protein TorRG33x02_220720, partial [Trema orientale]